jgi:hypothetical protein
MVEKTMGTDRITGKQIASEGLMQLSYQDVANYKQLFDCGFNWKVDRDLASNDPQKSIFAPYRNLRCGLLILNQKIKINNEISTPKTYWSVLRPAETNTNSKVSWLAKQTQSLSFCRKPSSKN